MDLRTDRLDLVPLDPQRDATDLHPAWSDPAVLEPMGEHEPTASLAQTVDRLTAMSAGPGIRVWTVRLTDTTSALGVVGMFAAPEETGIAGITWRLRRDSWGRGIMSEAATAVVEHLLQSPEIRGVEAWIQPSNARSIGVARRAGMDLRGYLPHATTGYQVVMGRSRDEAPLQLLSASPTLAVHDVGATAHLLHDALGLETRFTFGEPPEYAGMAVGVWSSSPMVFLMEADEEDHIAPVELYIDVTDTQLVHDAAVKAGLTVDGPPVDRPWHRREITVTMPEGHRFRVGAAI